MGFPKLKWNFEQNEVLDTFEESMQAGKPRRVRVEGPAASGKSALVQELARRAEAYYGDPDAVMVLAPTHTAADAVGGRTMHSALRLPFTPPLEALSEPDQLGLEKVRVVIIDNANQAHQWVMHCADSRFREATRDHLPFGGRIVFVFGDSKSWGPVPPDSYHPDYSKSSSESFPIEIKLSECYYEDASFAKALGRLKRGVLSEKDEDRFENQRLENMKPSERERFAHAPHIYAGRAEADFFTNKYKSQHGGCTEAEGARTYARAGNQEPYKVKLWPGAPVVLTTSLPGEAEAGTLGVVCSVAERSVDVQFGEAGEVTTLTEPLPLAAPQGYTLPKAMGLRFDKVVVVLPEGNWGEHRFQYAAVSRAKGWDALAFKDVVPSMDEKSVMNQIAYDIFGSFFGKASQSL